MTAQEQNLDVVTEHLTYLAGRHARVSDLITGANRTASDIAADVVSSHGIVCATTGIAVSFAETQRKAAGTAMFTTSTELDTKLVAAATNYEDVDYREGRSLGDACQV